MKKCFIYCRQSSGSGDAGTSLSIQQQLTNCLEAARKLDLEVSGVFTDANISGKTYPSGKNFEETAAADKGFQLWFDQQTGAKKFRSGLGNMMERLTEVDFIVVDEITRLHRAASNSFLEQVMTFEITAANVKIIQVKGGTLDLRSFDQNLIHILKTRINDEQIANQKRKSIDSRRKLKDSGVFCNVKFYGAVYEGNKKFHFDTLQAEVIKYVFDCFLRKEPVSRIVSNVNRIYPGRFNQAKCFYATTLRHIVSQPLYAGLMYNSQGDLIKCCNAPPPLITEEQFFKAGVILADRKCHLSKPRQSGNKEPLIFSGFLRCANCGSNLLAVYDRERIVYKCPNGDCGTDTHCRKSRIYISGGISDLWGMKSSLMPLLVIGLIRLERKLHLSEAGGEHLEELKKKERFLKDKIKVAFELFENNILDEETYKSSVYNCMAKIQKIRQEQLEIKNINAAKKEMYLLCRRWKILLEKIGKRSVISNADYREMLSMAIDCISVAENMITVYSAAGVFTLPRISRDNRQLRVLPPSRLEKKVVEGKEQFEVVYMCGNDEPHKKNILEWQNLKVTLCV